MTTSPRRWIGRWIVVVGTVHIVLGAVVFRSTWWELLNDGLVNSVSGQPERELPFWFVAFGALGIVFGLLVDSVELQKITPLVSGAFVGLLIAMLLLMPASGGWLLVPPAIGLVLRARVGE